MQHQIIFTLLAFFAISGLFAQNAFLGITSNPVSKEKARKLNFDSSNGRYITTVVKNTAAERMGLQPFDYLVALNGKPFSNGYSLHDALEGAQAGQPVQVTFIRNGQLQTASDQFGTSAEADRRKISNRQDPFLGVGTSHYNGNGPKVDGVSIYVVDCSTAEEMGLQDQDIITKIDAYPILDWHDLTAAINNRAVGDPIQVTVNRNGAMLIKEASIKSEYATENADCQQETETEANLEEEILALEKDLEAAPAVEMENITEKEAEEMKTTKGVDMPIVNNLQIERLNIFPNPSNGIFNIQFELPETGNTRIRLFNSEARLVYDYDLGTFSGFFSDRIDLTNAYRGTYFLEIRQNEWTLTKKLIVQ